MKEITFDIINGLVIAFFFMIIFNLLMYLGYVDLGLGFAIGVLCGMILTLILIEIAKRRSDKSRCVNDLINTVNWF